MIVLGQNLKSLFTNHYSPINIHVVPNGADFEFPVTEEKTGDAVNILYLSNLQPSKGIEDVIDAIELIGSNQNKIHLTVVGQWRDEATKTRCLRKVKEQQLPVTFAGPVYGEEKLKYFARADIFIFPPRAPEGHPLVLVEAMATGLPIISTDQGAIIESVVDGENGYIVLPEHPEQIAEKINWLINHPEERKNMGKKSQDLYLDRFTKEKMALNFIKAFKKTVS